MYHEGDQAPLGMGLRIDEDAPFDQMLGGLAARRCAARRSRSHKTSPVERTWLIAVYLRSSAEPGKIMEGTD